MNHNILSRIIFCLSFLLTGVASPAQQPNEPVFKDGDKICFVGNSITNNAQFYNFINLYYATRYPDRKVVFVNCGISGDFTRGIINRMEKDILVHKPTWIVLMIGMNDVNHSLYSGSRKEEAGIKEKQSQALELYRNNLDIIIPKLLENGRKLILLKPTIYDQTGKLSAENNFGVNDALKKCADYTQILADRYHLPIVDYWTILNEINKQVQQKDSAATIIGQDRVHPGAPGHLVMAYEFLKTTGGAEYVSRMTIGKNSKQNACINCEIKDVVYQNESVEFAVREKSLPFPVAREAQSALSLIPFTERFNQEVLQIRDISDGKYRLAIDSVYVDQFTSSEFNKGINLALVKNTPQYKQAEKVMDLFTRYRHAFSMYRNIVTIELHHLPDSQQTMSLESREAFLNRKLEEKYRGTSSYEYYKSVFKSYISNKTRQAEIEKELPEIIETVYRINKPAFHSFRITRIK